MGDDVPEAGVAIERLDASGMLAELDALAGVLHAAVEAGASVNFILPFSLNEARIFWLARVLPALRSGSRVLLVARSAGRIAGTVMLDTDMPPNQAHRGEVTKLLVHPDDRRRGHARRLMLALEAEAVSLGRWLVTLDTRTGDSAAPLYRSLGYRTAGTLPFYCRATETERYDATTYMYKVLPGAPLDVSRAAAEAAPERGSIDRRSR
ncbi:MAG: GNAT family N-acetyltransferase [Azospirillaceae bacterium]